MAQAYRAGDALVPLPCVAFGIVDRAPILDPIPHGAWEDLKELQTALDERIALLSTIVIHEKIDRYSQAGNTVRKLDTLDSDVELADGEEQYSFVRGNGVALGRDREITGAWSFGELVTILRSTRDALSQQVLDNRSLIVENGKPVVWITFHFSSDSHRWFVRVDAKTYWLDVQGCCAFRREPARYSGYPGIGCGSPVCGWRCERSVERGFPFNRSRRASLYSARQRILPSESHSRQYLVGVECDEVFRDRAIWIPSQAAI